MDNEQQPQDERERIAELEREVERLRAQVGDDVPSEDDGEPITDADMPYMPSQTRAIVIPVIIGVAVFLAIIGLTMALSSGFDSFAKKAASSLVPDDLAESTRPGAPPAPGVRPAVKLAPMEKAESAEPPVRVPGL